MVSTYIGKCNSTIVSENQTDVSPARPIEKTMLWHHRMGHIGEKGLWVLHSKGMDEGIPKFYLDLNFCEYCIYGKQNQVRFPSAVTRARWILELIYNDVFGPVPILSLGGSVYYVSSIDYFSIKTCLYFIKNKSKVFGKFKEFKALVENQTEKKIKVPRRDNGGEFCGK